VVEILAGNRQGESKNSGGDMFRKAFALLLLLVAATSVAWAGKAEVYSNLFGGAIKGYDPVAYFTQGKPVKGSGDHEFEYKGATWKFASAENRMTFEKNPEKYAPQYGGYCAYAVSQGYTASIDPEAWSIVDGKLYLNYSKGVRDKWSQDIPGYIKQADANWPKVLM
jgi:YHS domain-containing protein